MRKRFELALRYRIMLAFWLFMLGGIVFSAVVYQRHMVIQEKLHLVEKMEELRNQVLEARRFEKNFLLYGGENNFRSLLEHISQAEQRLESLNVARAALSYDKSGEKSKQLLTDYRTAARRYWDRRSEPVDIANVDTYDLLGGSEMRNFGHTLTNTIDRAVKAEHERVRSLIASQRRSLVYSLLAFMLLSFLVAYYFYFQIVKPLGAINRAVGDITRGGMREIPPVSGALEIRSLIHVLNGMIRQLERKFEELIHREKLASLGTLTSGVAHELNNPLSNISTSAQILLEEMGNENANFQISLLSGIEEQVEKARDIVRSLLEFARQKEFDPLPVELTSLAENTLRLMKSQIPPHIKVEIQSKASVWVEGDSRHLSQAIMNVASNAVQAMSTKEGSLVVTISEKDENGVVEISDTGPGIPEHLLPKIFDPFFTTKEVGQGTGLGLYLVYGIMQKHNGRVAVNTEALTGTSITFEIPKRQKETAHG